MNKAKNLRNCLDRKAIKRTTKKDNYFVLTANKRKVYTAMHFRKRDDLIIALATYISGMKPKHQAKLQAALGWTNAIGFSDY